MPKHLLPRLLVAALLCATACGGGTGGTPPSTPPPQSYVPRFSVSYLDVSGRVVLPAGPAAAHIAQVSAFVQAVPVAPDGAFGPMRATDGPGGLVVALLDSAGELVAPAFAEGAPLTIGPDEILAGLVAFTDQGVSVGRMSLPRFLDLVRAAPGYQTARGLLLAALGGGTSPLDSSANEALLQALGGCVSAAFDAYGAAGSLPLPTPAPKIGREARDGPGCGPLVPDTEQVAIRQGSVEGRCGIYALNPACVFYGLEVATTDATSDPRALLLPARAGLVDLNWFRGGLSWNPEFLHAFPPTTKDIFATDPVQRGMNYTAVAYKRRTADGGPRAAQLAAAANTIYGCVIVMDIAARIYRTAPAVGQVSDVLASLAGDPEEFVKLIEAMETSEDGGAVALGTLISRLSDTSSEDSPEDLLEKQLEEFANEPTHPSTIAKYLYVRNGVGAYEDWSSAMKAGWKVHKAWKSALAAADVAGLGNRVLPYFWDLLLKPDVVNLCFTVEADGRLSTPDSSCTHFLSVPVFTWSPSVPSSGEPVRFDATRSLSGNGAVLQYLWDFNVADGVTPSQGDWSTNPIVSHTYPAPGTYTVELRVADGRAPRILRRTLRVYRSRFDYEAAVEVPLGAAPFGLAAGDLDGDGDQDAVATLASSGYVAVLRNGGKGLLTLERQVALSFAPGTVALGDVDGDKDIDVAIASGSAARIALLRNDGGLVFTAQADLVLPASTSVPRVRLEDLDGDGRADLVLADPNHGQVLVWRGDGTFGYGDPGGTLHRAYATGAQPVDVIVAKLDGDTDWDLVTANVAGDTLTVLEGDGSGGFTVTQAALPSGATTYGGPQWLAVGDVLPGGDRELVVGNARAGSISLFRRSTGVAGLQLEAVGPDWVLGETPGPLAVEDVDEDGRADVLRVRESSFEVRTHFLPGTWSDPGAAPATDVRVGYGPRDLLLADLDGDQNVDVCTANRDTYDVTVALGTGGRAFRVRTDLLTRDDAVSDEPYAAAVAGLYAGDFDPVAPKTGTGGDLAVIARLTNRLVLFRNREGRGDLVREQTLDTAAQPVHLAVGNLDADPEPEIAVACVSGSAVSVYDRQPDGRYALVEHVGVAEEPFRLLIVDVDHSGAAELVVCHYSPGLVRVLRYAPGQSPALQAVPGATSTWVALPHGFGSGHLDADAYPDFVSANYFAGTVSLIYGRSDATLESGSDFLGGIPTPLTAAIAQVDPPGDPYEDIVVTCTDGILIFPRTSDRTFGSPITIDPGIVPENQWTDVRVDDADRDGIPDILVQDSNQFTVSGYPPSRPTIHVLYGDGARGFPRHVEYLTAPGPVALASGDLTGDGRADLVACCHHWDETRTARRVSILRHR